MLGGFYIPFKSHIVTRDTAEREITHQTFAFDSEDCCRSVPEQAAVSRTFKINATELEPLQ